VEYHTVYRHTGWRHVDGVDVYLHAGGALGPTGPLDDIETSLGGSLKHYTLPPPAEGGHLKAAIRAALDVLDAGPDAVMVPLMAAAFRALIDPRPPWSVFVTGPTGTGKTVLAQLVSSMFGPELLSNAGISWSATMNAIEELAASAGSTVLVVDDWISRGSAQEVSRAHRDADRILRGAGNNQGRGRMGRDLRLRPTRPPKAAIIVTGESLPSGESLAARFVACHLSPGEVDLRRDGGPLVVAENHAETGLLAAGMSAYICHLAGRRAATAARFAELRTNGRGIASGAGGHQRLPDAVGGMWAAWRIWLEWAESVGGISASETIKLTNRARKALEVAAHAQADLTQAAKPDRQFIVAIQSALDSGRAHIAARDGHSPDGTEGAWGWRSIHNSWEPMGDRIGWLSGSGEVWLDPASSFAVAQRLGADTGDRINGDVRSLGRDLYLAGLLIAHDMTSSTPRYSARRRSGDGGHLAPMRRVWVLAEDTLRSESGEESLPIEPAAEEIEPEVPEFESF